MIRDARGWRLALVPDALINPRASAGAVRAGAVLPNVLGILEVHGYGVLQLPAPGSYGLLLAVIADQVAEYAHHGYAVVAIGVRGEPGDGLHWRRMAPLLRHRAVALPPRHVLSPEADAAAESERLAAFLLGYDVPAPDQRGWRI